MGYRNLGSKVHSVIHFTCISGIAVGLPLNKVVLSLSLMLGVLNLFIEADFRAWIKKILVNRFFLMIAGFWLLHVLGLLWSSELDFGLRDIRVKLPLLVIPFLLTIKPLKKGEVKTVVVLFLVSTLITSLLNFVFYQGWIGSIVYDDIRGMSLFGSHIRYGVMVGFAAITALYLFIFGEDRLKWLWLLCLTWFLYYTWYSQVISGFLALIAGLSALILLYLYKKRPVYAMIFGASLLLFPLSIILWIYNGETEKGITPSDLHQLPKFTVEGNPYVHYFVDIRDSRGNYLYINFCENEIEREWNKSSELPYYGEDLKGQKVRFTLIRYMTSKGLRKDAADFKKLTSEDIRNIENGIAEFEDSRGGIMARLHSIRYQLRSEADPNGHSLLQRLEFWEAGRQIIREHLLLGVGTGDVQLAFDEQYKKNKSPLFKENRLRAHNTYLTVWITFGVLGILFFFALGLYSGEMFSTQNYLGFAFILVTLSTFLIEDSLETQAGVTFFAFFWALFSSSEWPKINPS